MRQHRRIARAVIVVLLCVSASLAQTRGALMITANVRSSVLLSGTTPAGTDFSQGGDLTASVTVTVPPAAQSFSARAVVANNPGSSGYDLVAKLASAGSATIDGIALSAEEKVIASEAPYGVSQTHSVAVSGPDAVAIILTCRPR